MLCLVMTSLMLLTHLTYMFEQQLSDVIVGPSVIHSSQNQTRLSSLLSTVYCMSTSD